MKTPAGLPRLHGAPTPMTRVSTPATRRAEPGRAEATTCATAALSRAVQWGAGMQQRRIALSSLVALLLGGSLAACVDDEPTLAESTEELSITDSVPSGFYPPVTPAVFRGTDWRVQVVGANASGVVAWDIQPEAGLWGTPNPTVVATPLTARHVVAAQDAWGRTVIYAVAGSVLLRTQQTQPNSRVFNNWIYVDTSVMDREPSLAANQDGRLELAYVSSTGRVKTLWQTSPAGAWSSAFDTGYTTDGTPELVRDRQQRLELFVPRATAPCGFLYSRQRAPNGWQGWFPAANVAGGCVNTLAVGYADDATDVLGRTATGAIHHHTRSGSDYVFQAGPQSLFGRNTVRPMFVAKDDGRLFAFTAFNNCLAYNPTTSCADYYAAQRESGGWWAWQPFTRSRATAAVAAVDSLINNTYVFLLISPSAPYQRALFHY